MDSDKATDLSFESDDQYERTGLAEKIIKIIRSDIDVSPLVIDGKWGCGKTTFCLKLIDLMAKENKNHEENMDGKKEEMPLKPIYIDAFKDDHTGSPITTIISSIISDLGSDKAKSDKLIKAAIPIVRTFSKVGLKAVSGWVLKQDGSEISEEVNNAIKEGSNELIDASINAVLKDNIEAQKNITALKKVLSEVTADGKVVLFIDELDRCRPDFAIHLLEDVKHIFDIDNIQIMLVANVEQLESSVNHSYGLSTNAQEYLGKFIKLRIRLPDNLDTLPVNYDFQKNISYLHFYQLCVDCELGVLSSSINSIIGELIHKDKLSLRQVEYLVRNIRICYLIKKDLPSVREEILWMQIIGIYIQCFNKNLAVKILNDMVSADEMLDFFGKSMPVLDSDTSMLKDIAKVIFDEMNKDNNDTDRRQAGRLDFFGTTSYLGRIKSTLEIIKLESLQY